MSEKINRRDLMLEVAARLFMAEGYHATSVRQIADAVGCTEAALYYHFKEGKRALLQAVLESEFPSLLEIVDACAGATSLPDLIQRFGQVLEQIGRPRMAKMRWLLAAFPDLSLEERQIIHDKHLVMHQKFSTLIQVFIQPVEAADKMAWLLFCTGFGYGQLFWNLDMEAVCQFSSQDLMTTFVSNLTPA